MDFDLLKGSLNFFGREKDDQPFGLTPMTKIDDIAPVPKSFGAGSGLDPSLATKKRQHFGRQFSSRTIYSHCRLNHGARFP
jgi:hypothetical protein